MLIFLIRQQYYSVIEKGTGKSDKKFESSLQLIQFLWKCFMILKILWVPTYINKTQNTTSEQLHLFG